MKPEESEALDLLRQEFKLEFAADPDLNQIIEQLADQVAYYLEHKPDLLFSYFYRMDIDEQDVAHVLNFPQEEPVNILLAKMIFYRQVARAQTKLHYRQSPIEWDFQDDPYSS